MINMQTAINNNLNLNINTELNIAKSGIINYITGKTALNLNGADWHYTETMKHPENFTIAGINYINTSNILNNFGLYIRSDVKVPCASNERAIIDMIINSILKLKKPYFSFDDFLLNKKEIINIIKKISDIKDDHFTDIQKNLLDEWLKIYGYK